MMGRSEPIKAGDLAEVIDGLQGKASPNLRTPHCGKPTCVPTASMNVDATKPAWRCQDCIGMREHGCYCAAMSGALLAAKNEAESRELNAAQQLDEVLAVLRELVSLVDMKTRLESLHEMGHGTDWDDWRRRNQKAWAAARIAALGA